LTAGQTWSVTGALSMGATLSGTASALTVNFEHASDGAALWFLYGGDSETGPVQLNGGQLQLGGGTAITMLNANDGQPVGLSSAQLFLDASAAVGPLTSVGSSVGVSTHTLTVAGPISFDGHSTMSSLLQAPGTGNFGVLDASGSVALAGHLDVQQIGLGGPGSSCSPLPDGSEFTILSAAGLVSGTFANAPAGATLPLWAGCTRGQGNTTLAEIGYTTHTVTATIVAAPSLASVASALSSAIKLSAKQAKIGTLLKHGGYTIAWPAFAGYLSVELTAKVHGKQVTILVVNTTSLDGAKQQNVLVKLTKSGKRLLTGVSKLKVKATGVFQPVWAPVTAPPAVHKTFTLKR
jgi:hypothetical protein